MGLLDKEPKRTWDWKRGWYVKDAGTPHEQEVHGADLLEESIGLLKAAKATAPAELAVRIADFLARAHGPNEK